MSEVQLVAAHQQLASLAGKATTGLEPDWLPRWSRMTNGAASHCPRSLPPIASAGRWRLWPDRPIRAQKRRRARAVALRLTAAEVESVGTGRLRHRNHHHGGRRAKTTRPRASEPKRTVSARRSGFVAPRGIRPCRRKARPGGDEGAAKAPRQVKHDRGWSESPMSNTDRSRPRRQQFPRRPRSPKQGGRVCPHTPRAPVARQSRCGSTGFPPEPAGVSRSRFPCGGA